jgi:hypothetical protein
MDATADDVTAYLAAVTAKSPNAKKDSFYGAVYRRYRVPRTYDWPAYVFNNEPITVDQCGTMRRLQSLGAAARGSFDPAPEFRPLPILAWRRKRDHDGPVGGWEAKPDYIGLIPLPDAIGVQFDANARNGKEPWTWNGDPADPIVYDIMVTLSLDVGLPLTAKSGTLASGERARECFLDCGNTIPPVHRINCILPVDASYNVTADAPGTNADPRGIGPAGTKTHGTPVLPDIFVTGLAQVEAELAYLMRRKNASFVQGNISLWGLRIDPWPIGHLFGSLLIDNGETPTRETMNLNACIRSFKMSRADQSTAYTLDGR